MRTTLEKCAWCNGTRKEPGYNGDADCHVCKGKGKVKVRQSKDFESVKCKSCKGSGRDNEGKFCFSCRGSGWTGFVKEI